MNSRLRSIACAALAAAAALVATLPAHGQQWPAKVVRVIVPFAPGGGSDITARQFSHKLSEALGQQFVVDNRGGAAGLIGMELTARAPADGYTIMMMSASFATSSALHQPAFDPINSIIGVHQFGYTPFVLTIHPSLPPKNVKELINLARTTKGGLTYASPGVGSITHLSTELFMNMAKIQMVHVPYKSTGAAMADLLSGQAPIIVGSLLPVVPHLKTGKLRALAVTTAKRWYSLPDVPTLGETLPGFEVELWFGAMVPKGTPEPVIERLNSTLNKILQQPDVKSRLETEGMVAAGGTPQQFQQRIRREYDRWLKLIKTQGLKPGKE